MHDINPQLLAQLNQLLKESQVHTLRRRVRRKIQNQHLRSRLHPRQLMLQLLQQRACPFRQPRCSAPSSPQSPAQRYGSDSSDSAPRPYPHRPAPPGKDAQSPPSTQSSQSPRSPDRDRHHTALVPVADRPPQPRNPPRQRVAMRLVFCAASISLSTISFGVAPSGFPIPKSIMSSPRLRAAAFNSLVMLNTYAGRRSASKLFHAPACSHLVSSIMPTLKSPNRNQRAVLNAYLNRQHPNGSTWP